MTPATTKIFTITYPEDYAIPELAGGTVDYTVTLKEIKKRVVPALDDELAKDLGEFDSLDALRARVRDDLEHEAHARGGAPAAAGRAEAARDAGAVPGAGIAGRARDRSPARGFRAAPDGSADRSAAGEHRLERVPRRPARAGHRSGGSAIVLDEIAKRDTIDVTDEDIDARAAALRGTDRPQRARASRRGCRKTASSAVWRRGCGAKKP